MVVYSVGYWWADMCNTPIFITDLVTEDFNKILAYIANERDKGSMCDYTIKKWLDGEVISEYVVDKNNIKTLEDIED